MTFLEYLIKTYGYNEPILSEEISYNGYSKPWINKELGSLCSTGQLARFDRGVYYVPKLTKLGPSKLNPVKVIEKKYIFCGNERVGYYSGPSLLNQIGLSMQVPNTVEIYTNNESAKVREVSVGSVRVLLRKARTEINSENAGVQCFLELMNFVSPTFFNEERRQIASEYIRKCGIKKSQITEYAAAFPDKAIRTLVESEMIYHVAQ